MQGSPNSKPLKKIRVPKPPHSGSRNGVLHLRVYLGLEGFGLEAFSFAVPHLPGCSTAAREKRRVIRVQSRALSKRSEARASIKQGGVEPFARWFEMFWMKATSMEQHLAPNARSLFPCLL